MSRFLRTLAKVGLVELSEEERARDARKAAPLDDEKLARILAEEEAQAARSAPAAEAEPLVVPSAIESTGEERASLGGLSFEALYRGAQLPASPFPAEKLLKLLEGLRAMDPAMRKAAVLAMDAADDAWTIDDALLDAERKTRTLRHGIERLAAGLTQAEQQAQREVVALDEYTQKAADTIRKQISELEKLLQQELEGAAQKKAEISANLHVAREGAARERLRFEHEIARFSEISVTFGPTPAPKTQG
jgi:hypothetical protein